MPIYVPTKTGLLKPGGQCRDLVILRLGGVEPSLHQEEHPASNNYQIVHASFTIEATPAEGSS